MCISVSSQDWNPVKELLTASSRYSNSDRHTATEIDFEAGSSLNQGLGEVLSCKLPVTILKSDLPSMSEFKFV